MIIKRLLIVMFFLLAGRVLAAADTDQVYIFGYGSLMNTVARTATAPDAEGVRYIPVKIRGYKRTWNLWANFPAGSMRVLGAVPADGAYINGLIYGVSARDLPKFNQRESPVAYQRVKVPLDSMGFYNKSDERFFLEKKPEVYIYQARQRDVSEGGRYLTDWTVHKDKAIYRSYLDVVITGCHEVDSYHGLDGVFFGDCGDTLSLDNLVIKNDLASPVYPRHPEALLIKKQKELDALKQYLEQDWPKYYQGVGQVLQPDNLAK